MKPCIRFSALAAAVLLAVLSFGGCLKIRPISAPADPGISDPAPAVPSETDPPETDPPETAPPETEPAETLPPEEIVIDDFAKVQLKVGKILTAEKVEGSKKLLHFTVDTGERVRSIVSGVAKFYTPEEMVGKEVVVVANLKPATLGGVLSEGMILFAEDAEGNVIAVSPEKSAGGGATVC